VVLVNFSTYTCINSKGIAPCEEPGVQAFDFTFG